MTDKIEKIVKGRRILWMWCPGHKRYEIEVLERHVGSQEFETLCKMLWDTDALYRITHEHSGVATIDENWSCEQVEP